MEQGQHIAGTDPCFVVRAHIPEEWREGDAYEEKLHWNLIRDERVRNPIYVDVNITRHVVRIICDGRIDPLDMIDALSDRGFFSIRKGDGDSERRSEGSSKRGKLNA